MVLIGCPSLVEFSSNPTGTGRRMTVHLWDYQPQDAARRVCALAGAPITRKEWALYVQGANYRPPCG